VLDTYSIFRVFELHQCHCVKMRAKDNRLASRPMPKGPCVSCVIAASLCTIPQKCTHTCNSNRAFDTAPMAAQKGSIKIHNQCTTWKQRLCTTLRTSPSVEEKTTSSYLWSLSLPCQNKVKAIDNVEESKSSEGQLTLHASNEPLSNGSTSWSPRSMLGPWWS